MKNVNPAKQIEELLNNLFEQGEFSRNRLLLSSDYHSENGSPNVISVSARKTCTGFTVIVRKDSNLSTSPVWRADFSIPFTGAETSAIQIAFREALSILRSHSTEICSRRG